MAREMRKTMAEEKPEQTPKIVVDDDWKAQARAEKERLAAEQQAKQRPASPAGPAPGAPQGAPQAAQEHPGLPPADFIGHVASLASQALMALGALPDPQTGKRYLDLELAKYTIDTLKMLEAKTAGNLSDEEKRQLDSALYRLRSAYIQAASAGNII
jgi:hypothetical protein